MKILLPETCAKLREQQWIAKHPETTRPRLLFLSLELRRSARINLSPRDWELFQPGIVRHRARDIEPE